MSQKKPLKELFGNRVIISADFVKKAKDESKKEGGVELIGVAKKEAEEKKIAENDKFTILQVGDDCNDKLKPGQEVYIENATRMLNPEGATMLFEKGELIGFIVAERQIAGVF
jgi:hypothetical protein